MNLEVFQKDSKVRLLLLHESVEDGMTDPGGPVSTGERHSEAVALLVRGLVVGPLV